MTNLRWRIWRNSGRFYFASISGGARPTKMCNGPSRSWSGGGSRRSVSLPRFYRRKQKECTQKATKDAKRWGDQLGGTGQILGVARFLDMPRRIAQERVPTTSNVGSRDVTWASQPTPLILFRVFSRVSRAPFLRQTLIGLRVLCGLLCVCSSYTGYRRATVFQKQSGALRLRPKTNRRSEH
jgi:hypothetical protein